jgi:hypothetical protein
MNICLEQTWYEVFMTLIFVNTLVQLCTDVIYIITMIIHFVNELKFQCQCKVSKDFRRFMPLMLVDLLLCL